jgi:S-formylglutathione hydrolase FrmB
VIINPPPPQQEEESRELRAIAVVSMGAYGAMNIGTKHPELYTSIIDDLIPYIEDVVLEGRIRR